MPNARHIVHTEMMRAMGRSLLRLMGGVKKYPPKPADSKYRRTGTLGRSITTKGGSAIHSVKRVHGGVEGRWGTNVKYAPYVIGPLEGPKHERQAEHMRHWWRLDEEGKRMTPKVKAEFDAAADRIANKLGPLWTKTIVIEVDL